MDEIDKKIKKLVKEKKLKVSYIDLSKSDKK